MSNYVLIESQYRRGSEPADPLQLAESLASRGARVTVFLVQNGVLAARRYGSKATVTNARKAGVTVLADDFSLRERGIDATELREGIESSPLDFVVDRMAAGDKVIWH